MAKPSITFFCELETAALQDLFVSTNVIKALTTLDANLSIGLLDLSPERAQIIKNLNRAGIPVTAWILLSKEDGYWTSLDTIQATTRQYLKFKDWKTKHKLEFAAIGLDIEPKLETVLALGKNPRAQIPNLIKHFFAKKDYGIYEMDARILIQMIHSDGFAVETYQFPTVVDERAAKSNILAKTLGIPALPSDREVLMLYSSFFPAYSDSILWSYAKQAYAIGVGSTGGGVELEGMSPLKILRWIDLKRDLLLASQAVNHLYIFSLEGCVTNDYMDRLIQLDWNSQVTPPVRNALGISLIRLVGQGVLWTLSHPFEVLAGLLAGFLFTRRIKK